VPRARLGSDGAPGESAVARFHRVNRLDWIGVAHNAALVAFERRLARGEVHGDVCAEILDMVAGGRYLPSTVQLGATELRTAASRTLSSRGACPPGAAAVRPVALMQSGEGLSPEASALVSEIYASAGSTLTASDLAVALLPILDRASQLSPIEADIVLAGASVAQASKEHWEVTLTDAFVASETDGILSSYGGCFAQYTTAVDGVSACMGLRQSPLVQPTTDGRHRRDGAPALLAAAYFGCPKPNRNEVVKQDVTGAIGGAIGAAWTGAGVVAGAVGGGVGMSTAEMLWQMGSAAWCYGSEAIKGTRIQPT
jgi:hypothetical protein